MINDEVETYVKKLFIARPGEQYFYLALDRKQTIFEDDLMLMLGLTVPRTPSSYEAYIFHKTSCTGELRSDHTGIENN